MLKFFFLKPYKITDRLIFSCRKNNYNIFYNMFDKNTGQLLGKMVARPEIVRDSFYHFSPNAEEYSSFYIHRLEAYERYKGIGTAFINFAKKESVKYLCSGNLHLIAKNPLNPADSPFIFYRKLGFSFNKYFQNTQKYIDDCIQKGIPADLKKCGFEAPMYFERCIVNQKEDIKKTYELKIKFPYLFT